MTFTSTFLCTMAKRAVREKNVWCGNKVPGIQTYTGFSYKEEKREEVVVVMGGGWAMSSSQF